MLARKLGHTKFVVLLSLDGGTGTVKLLARALVEGMPDHALSSIFMLAEAQGITEGHADLLHCFGNVREQLERILRDDVRIVIPHSGEEVKLEVCLSSLLT